MNKSYESPIRNRTTKHKTTKPNDLLSNEKSIYPIEESLEDRRFSYSKEGYFNREKIPKYFKKTQYKYTTDIKEIKQYETCQSLIMNKGKHHFRQINHLKNQIPQVISHTNISQANRYINEQKYEQNRNQKFTVQKLSFENFLEQAKKEKQRFIIIPSNFTSNLTLNLSKTYKRPKNLFIKDLRDTQDTVPEKQLQMPKRLPCATDFKRIRQLGKGKNGQVFLALHLATNFICAMKVIKKRDISRGCPSQTLTIHNQLLRQIKIQSSSSHPNIIQLYCVFDDCQNIYLIQQLGLGGQLYQLMKIKEKFTEESTALISREVVKGLEYLHKKSVIHRDVKPENIVMVFGIAKLCDFGWSVYCPKELRSTLCGTPLYLSPEILVGEQYNQKIDIWAFGTLVFQLFTGQNPFRIQNKTDLKKIITDDIKFDDNFPSRLKKFLQFILKKSSNERPTAQKLLKHEFLLKYAELQTSQQISSF